jgi:membrane-associated phospholipid phosphatase
MGHARAQHVEPLRYNLTVDLSLTLGALALWTGSELAKPVLAPEDCRWCSTNALDEGVRSGLRWEHTGTANRASNWLVFGVLPLGLASAMAALAARDHAIQGTPVDLLVIAQAVTLSALINQLVKFSAGRERPFVHALPPEQRAHTAHPADNNLSFYSGHTSMAFSLAVAAGTTAQIRHYRGAPFIWAIGLPLAALAGYLRIAADRHNFTDVLVGALVGSGVGFLTPWFLHRQQRN